jgi:thiamine biosynthesis lipoprotein
VSLKTTSCWTISVARGALTVAFALAVLSLVACTEVLRLPEYELTGAVMGTTFTVKLIEPAETVNRSELGREISDRLEEIEQRFSTYRPSSELSLVNGALTTDWIPVSVEFCDVVAAALSISRQTNGAFDITVGPLVMLWGFGPGSERTAPPGDEMVAEARSSVGYDKIDTDCSRPAVKKALPGVQMDLSAFVKGYAVDEAAWLVDERGVGNYLVEIGGELRVAGHNSLAEPWAIAVEKPDTGSRSAHAVVHISDSGMATSGDYRNFFEHDGVRYSHTIDPATGRPVTHDAAAVTVIGENSAEADALATALLVMGPDDGLQFARDAGIAAFFLLRRDPDFEELVTPEFDALLN